VKLLGRWSDENRNALEELIDRNHARSPIAVFDWDNTCIRGDIADAVYHEISLDLAFHFESPGFWDWITENGSENNIVEAYHRYCTKPHAESRLRLRVGFEQARKRMHDGPDDASAWAWDSGAFVGWTTAEVREYTRRVVMSELTRPEKIETIGTESETIEIRTGLRLHAEMMELMQALQERGWQVWVLSASPQWEIEAFAGLYGIPPTRTIGMRRELHGDRITSQVAPPVSYSDGKLDAYRLFINYERAPSLVAGDSLGDWKILESSEAVRILIDPAPAQLREFALWRKGLGESWLLQTFD
jgi:phosphoserine phosphatase